MKKMDCPECDGEMVLKGSKYGKFYGCSNFPKCDVTHGAHPDGRPLGIPANAKTRHWRIKAHKFFDRLWKYGTAIMSRNEAYRCMQEVMDMTPEEAHIARFTEDECRDLIKKLEEILEKC